jgi:lysophospholipase L1-like esterase
MMRLSLKTAALNVTGLAVAFITGTSPVVAQRTSQAPELAVSLIADPANKIGGGDMTALPVSIGGRVMVKSVSGTLPTASKGYAHKWPGVYFETAFKGDQFFLKFDDSHNEYRLFIDQRPPVTLAQPGKTEYRVAGLAAGKHHIRLEKVTESISAIGSFDGFYIPKKGTALPVKKRSRQIEFIGDSDMTGYGIRSKERQCTRDEVRLLSDTQAAYPAKTAKQLDADFQINAISGRGLVRNYDGSMPDLNMAAIYPFTLAEEGGTYTNSSWQPQIIVVALGANDFSMPIKSGEKWQASNELIADYLATYERFLVTLSARHPKASLLVIWPDTSGLTDTEDAARADKGRVYLSEKARLMGFRSTEFTTIPDLGFDTSACDHHFSRADHEKLTQWLAKKFMRYPQFK